MFVFGRFCRWFRCSGIETDNIYNNEQANASMRKYIITIMSGGEAHKPNGFAFFSLSPFFSAPLCLSTEKITKEERKKRICFVCGQTARRTETNKKYKKKIRNIMRKCASRLQHTSKYNCLIIHQVCSIDRRTETK